jgi:hypothetical protein
MKQVVKALKSTSARSIHSSEWSEADGVLYFHGKIYVPPTADIRRKIMALHKSHIAGHPGRWKTLELVTRNYWWPHMSWYISQYTATCDLSPHQGPETATDQPPRVSSDTGHPLGHHKCQLHSRTPGV